MKSLFGIEIAPGTQWLIAVAIILGLLAIMWLLLRNFASGKLRLKGQGNARNRQPRLGVVDMFDLDRQRQLVLIRRDNVEHLILIGGSSDVVIESNIMRGNVRAPAPTPVTEIIAEPKAENTAVASMATQSMREINPPVPQMPQAKPTEAAISIEAHKFLESKLSDTAQFAPSPTAASAPATAPSPAPAPKVLMQAVAPPVSLLPDVSTKPTKIELDDMSRQLEEALKRPFAAVRPSPAATPDVEKPAKAPEALAQTSVTQEPVKQEAVTREQHKASEKPVEKVAALSAQSLPFTKAGPLAQNGISQVVAAPIATMTTSLIPAAAFTAPAAGVVSASGVAPGVVAPLLAPAPAKAESSEPVPATPVTASTKVLSAASADFDLEQALAQALNIPMSEPPRVQPMQAAAPVSAPVAPAAKLEMKAEPAKVETARSLAVSPFAPQKPAQERPLPLEPAQEKNEVKSTAQAVPVVAAPVIAAAIGVGAAAMTNVKEAAATLPYSAQASSFSTSAPDTASAALERPTSKPADEVDPFSIDAIESEFARLLGREATPASKG